MSTGPQSFTALARSPCVRVGPLRILGSRKLVRSRSQADSFASDSYWQPCARTRPILNKLGLA